VRFVETDMMGVVHHSNHFRWFEMARVEYLRQAGVLLLDLMAEDIVFPITDVSCQYKASARFDDWLLIQAKLIDLSRAKMVFDYEVLRESDKVLLAKGRTQNVFTDGSGRILRLPPKYYSPLHALFELDK
jgi:acyl-CoA thioester hydrolase